jgi:hypothetical protein
MYNQKPLLLEQWPILLSKKQKAIITNYLQLLKISTKITKKYD